MFFYHKIMNFHTFYLIFPKVTHSHVLYANCNHRYQLYLQNVADIDPKQCFKSNNLNLGTNMYHILCLRNYLRYLLNLSTLCYLIRSIFSDDDAKCLSIGSLSMNHGRIMGLEARIDLLRFGISGSTPFWPKIGHCQ